MHAIWPSIDVVSENYYNFYLLVESESTILDENQPIIIS